MTLSTGDARTDVPATKKADDSVSNASASASKQTALVERFVIQMEKLGVKTTQVAGAPASIAATTVEVLRVAGARSAMIADDLGDLREPIQRALVDAGVTIAEGDTVLLLEPVEAGISLADFGVAETGSIGVVGNALQPRIATLLPPVHLALVEASTIVASLDEAGDRLEQMMRPGGNGGVRYASMITGPSRTADVEKTLAVGVHGPRALHVVVFEMTS